MKILTSPRPSPSPNSNPKKEKANLAVTKILWATHPTTFRGSERWEGVPSSGGQQEEEHRVVLQVQVEHYQKKSQDQKPKSWACPCRLRVWFTYYRCFIVFIFQFILVTIVGYHLTYPFLCLQQFQLN